MDTGQIITTIIGALGAGGVLGGVLAWLRYRRVDTATADKTAAEAWAILAQNLMAENARLCLRVEALEQGEEAKDRRIDDLETEIDELRAWIVQQGLTPPPRKRGSTRSNE